MSDDNQFRLEMRRGDDGLLYCYVNLGPGYSSYCLGSICATAMDERPDLHNKFVLLMTETIRHIVLHATGRRISEFHMVNPGEQL